MIAKWKLWTAAAAGSFALWLLAFLMVWHTRTQHQVDWRAALNDWFGNLVMLGWVYDYQTLVAGLLAAFAATTLILNSSLERKRRIEDAGAAKRASLLETISALEMSVKRFGALVVDKANEARIDRIAATVEQQCAAITHEAQPLANCVMYALTAIENDEGDNDSKFALAWAAALCLSGPDRHFQTGKFVLHKLKLTADEQAKVASLSAKDKARYKDWLEAPG